jgi:uncharacterized flavoprotein (TIGR03862 family)
MAAEVLASHGVRVAVYEHMPSVGRKLLLAGRSGLNLTHSERIEDLVSRYGEASMVVAAVRAYPPAALRTWCAGLGEPTYVGSSGRVFPESFRATPLLRAWLARLHELDVSIHPRHRWLGWGTTPDGRTDPGHHRFQPGTGKPIDVRSDISVFALGGASWPRVGSDGGWVTPFRDAGVQVREMRPANCGVQIPWTPRFADRFAGTPIKNVALRVGDVSARGDVTVSRGGIESGPVYTHSATIRDSIERGGACTITIDLHPDLTLTAVQGRLAHRRPKDSAATGLRRALGLAPVAVAFLREATNNHLPTDPAELAALVKGVPLVVHATMSLDRAISTAGGLTLAEVDDRFMVRRLPGTFVAGEMLDWEAPTGGYLLQASLSTAVAAANGAINWLQQTSA